MSDKPPPSPAPRRRIAALAAVFLLAQALLPFRYYLDPATTDERFAWRMFSSVAMSDCVAVMYETLDESGRAVERQVPPQLMDQWQPLLDSARPQIAHKLMRWRCDRPGVQAVRLVFRCKAPDGHELPPRQWRLARGQDEARLIEPPTP